MRARLRQVALVAAELDPVVERLCDAFDLSVAYRDPGVALFGLVNAVMPVGIDFLEVVAPVREGTTAGRFLERRGGDGGYMAIFQVPDLAADEARLAGTGIRTVWTGALTDGPETIRGMHLHPRDVGGAIVSLDQADPPDSWRWAGPEWRHHVCDGMVGGIAGITVGAEDPDAMAARWALALGGPPAGVEFAPAGPRGEGIDEIRLWATEPSLTGEVLEVGGCRFRLV